MTPFIKIESPRTDYYPLKGGLDLVSPAIAIDPGKCFDARNYVPEITGGYRRMLGHERFDGRSSPTGTPYWVLSATLTGTATAGATLTGATSGATGRILGTRGTAVVLSRVTGAFVNGEIIRIGATPIGTSTSASQINAASLPADDADYALWAANDARADIQAPPGSGPPRGLFVLRDVLYCFKDNSAGTAGLLYKQSATGWQLIPLGTEIQFTGAVGQINPGDIIKGGTSGATAVVSNALLRTGTWTASGAGTLIINTIVGTFASGEALQVSTVTKATAASAATPITRAPGGALDAVEATFTGNGDAKRMYGADGVNLAFEFDGTIYVPIRTGLTVDKPTHAIVHKNYLMLSFGSSLQYSGIGNPYSWTALTGAAELTANATITGFRQISGNTAGAALAVFTQERALTLYGSSSQDFNLVPGNAELGFQAQTFQVVGNDIYGLTARGIQALKSTQEYGDFNYAAVSFPIQPYMERARGKQTCSVTSQAFSQYRLYFNDGTAVVVGLTGGKVSGLMPLNYGKIVRCATSKTLSTGKEVTFFGADDGFVYQDNVGTSFDGAAIEAWIRLAFNNLKSPSLLKRFLRAIFDVKADGFAQARVAYDLGYANPDVNQSNDQPLNLVGAGGYWDQVFWDNFTWDTQVVATASVSIDGTETNLAFLFYSNRAQDSSHVVQGVNLHYLPRRIKRG